MPILLDHMPFLKSTGEIAFRGENVLVRANQIIIWVSLSVKRQKEPNPAAQPFPAILDTGLAHSFAIQERHLVDWAGMRPDDLSVFGAVRDRGQRVLLRNANVWVHRNECHSREPLADQPQYPVSAPVGIAVYPGGDFPRLPIFGLQAIADNELVLKVCGWRRMATLRTVRKWWPFG